MQRERTYILAARVHGWDDGWGTRYAGIEASVDPLGSTAQNTPDLVFQTYERQTHPHRAVHDSLWCACELDQLYPRVVGLLDAVVETSNFVTSKVRANLLS